MDRTLGTLLRHLIELLDEGVQRAYDDLGLDYRPRFTPVVRVLRDGHAQSVRGIAESAGLTHSAASQTLQLMRREGLVEDAPNRGVVDGRERRVVASERLKSMLPILETQWRATNAAAADLDAELSISLHQAAREAIAALEHWSFAKRIALRQGGDNR
ncbi:MAG: helix-turn-helix domain-containing protein [Myxococcota bacterium]